MSSRQNGPLGAAIEEAAADAFALDLVRGEHDAIATEDTPVLPAGATVEVKAAAFEMTHSGGGTRRGRFWIGRRQLDALDDADGYLLLVVHDDGTPVEYRLMTPAAFRREAEPTFSPTGGHEQASEAARVTWSTLLDPETTTPEPPGEPAQTPETATA